MDRRDDPYDSYTTPEYANVRYLSSAQKSINGWAYIYTMDDHYVYRLSIHHEVEIRNDNAWVAYDGYLPDPNAYDSSENDPLLYYNPDDDSIV